MLNRYLPVAFLLCAECLAQTAPPQQAMFYKLDFVVKELSGGKVSNSRSYMTIIRAEHGSQMIRTGDKVPVSNGSSWTYIDAGVNIDVIDVAPQGNDLSMHVNADISSAEKDGTMPQPIIRQNRWGASVIVPLRKPTTLFSSDSTGSKTQTQLEVTATPIQ